MTRTMQWIFAAMLFAATATGCIPRSAPGTTYNYNNGGGGGGGGGGNALIRIINNSNVAICYVRFSPASAPSWNGTPDALGSATISSGTASDFTVGAGTWDVMLEACGGGNSPFGHPKLYEGRHQMDAGGAYTLSFP